MDVRFPLVVLDDGHNNDNYVRKYVFRTENSPCERYHSSGRRYADGYALAELGGLEHWLTSRERLRIENQGEVEFLKHLRREIYLENRKLRAWTSNSR